MAKFSARGVFAAFAVFALASISAFAQSYSDDDRQLDPDAEELPLAERILRDPDAREPIEVPIDSMLTKLGRGFTNVFTSFFELPHNFLELRE